MLNYEHLKPGGGINSHHHGPTASKSEVNLVQQPSRILFQNLGLYKFQFRSNKAGECQWYNKLILNSNTVTVKNSTFTITVFLKKQNKKSKKKKKDRQSFDSLRWPFWAIYFKAGRITLWTNVTTYPAKWPTLRSAFTSPVMKRFRCWTTVPDILF